MNFIDDIKLFLDFDIAILGRSWENYMLYVEKVRKEYGLLSEKEFLTGRNKFIKFFLKKKRLFKTDLMYYELEKQARNNLLKELNKNNL